VRGRPPARAAGRYGSIQAQAATEPINPPIGSQNIAITANSHKGTKSSKYNHNAASHRTIVLHNLHSDRSLLFVFMRK
jgi:hypothetical protein